ncbi:flagellar basal body rod protein FlgB [Serpentinicella sp. ANB-PHB4]|uniref:flagellar basal body rod protein FlgB n=1 Tax=Serpentinicella sp. ANB-PHB4 TaxID=3074076 RepID=UPI00285E34DC|nr:flagellar basal body rod protein FlgB [Serpentinicella sp. ANB-PHB4]MDR5658274.1 flagellar basal body rod protein FlgB [Serpentinicella sp. ANB-PHB4]
MLKNIYNDINQMTGALNASWKRNEVISNNIANANTPNYKRMDVEFGDVLKNKLGKAPLTGKITNKNHIPFNINKQDYRIHTSDKYSTRRDKNNVDIDVEMAELAKNELYYNTMSTHLNNRIQNVKLVITEGKR